jgi:hypothetical protein
MLHWQAGGQLILELRDQQASHRTALARPILIFSVGLRQPGTAPSIRRHHALLNAGAHSGQRIRRVDIRNIANNLKVFGRAIPHKLEKR